MSEQEEQRVSRFSFLAGQHAIRDGTDLVCDRKKKKQQHRIVMLNGSVNKMGGEHEDIVSI